MKVGFRRKKVCQAFEMPEVLTLERFERSLSALEELAFAALRMFLNDASCVEVRGQRLPEPAGPFSKRTLTKRREMKRILCCACVAVLTMAALPCLAAGSSWDGTWKLDQAKSKLTGDTFTIESKGNGMMRYTNGSAIAYDFACDGKAYPTIADRTITCTGSPAAGFDYVAKAGDKVLSKSHHAISADGKTMTVHGEAIHPDGSSSSFDDVYKRETGTKGLVGKWRNVKSSQSGSDTMIISTKGDWIKMEFPEYKETVQGKMDGSNLALSGPDIPPGVWQTIKAEGPNKLHFTVKYKDKVLEEGTETLSADGKVVTEEEWEPGKMNEKAVLVYERS